MRIFWLPRLTLAVYQSVFFLDEGLDITVERWLIWFQSEQLASSELSEWRSVCVDFTNLLQSAWSLSNRLIQSSGTYCPRSCAGVVRAFRTARYSCWPPYRGPGRCRRCDTPISFAGSWSCCVLEIGGSSDCASSALQLNAIMQINGVRLVTVQIWCSRTMFNSRREKNKCRNDNEHRVECFPHQWPGWAGRLVPPVLSVCYWRTRP